ncbi:MAG: c-type cytochrome [Verrucomicrobia bacterium]|nr:c-type cytochrome [Verrucomicrobiota bacterium]
MTSSLHRLIIFQGLFVGAWAAAAADSLVSKTTHAAAYGPTKNAVTVDPAKDLPRYPAVEPKDALKTWQVKKGFKLEIAASEPQVRDPIALCFDERGRMFVCEMIDYSQMRDVTPHLGRISVLEDVDGDGHLEKSQVFADNLPWPTGLIWANGGLYVGATPDIWRFEDRDGDGKAEVREQVYTGFGTGLKILNVQGLLNSFQWGQDNRVHVLAGGGNRGVITCLKRPELKGVELGGKDFWFDPLTHEFGLEGGGAQYGMSFDNYGRKFACSNSDHLQCWVYDERYAARNPFYEMPPARKSIAADGGAAEVFRISPDEPWRIMRTRWRIAGVVKGAVEGGGRVSGYFTGATGTTIYRGDAYGPDFVNNSFTGDAGGQLIHRKIIRDAEDGIGLIGERPADEHGFEFAASKDTWVRVVNFANAPDGCLYVCDMYREVIEHPWSVPDEIKKHLDLNNGNDRGRIYRIVPDQGAERIGQKVRLDKASTEGLVKTLSHSNGWHRDTASRLLYEKQDKAAVPMLKTAVAGSSALAGLHSLGVLKSWNQLDERTLADALQHADPFVRERAVVCIEPLLIKKEISKSLAEKFKRLFADPSARVRFQKALTLGSFSEDDSAIELSSMSLLSSEPMLHSAIFSASSEMLNSIYMASLYDEFQAFMEPKETIAKARTASPEFRQKLIKIIGAMGTKEYTYLNGETKLSCSAELRVGSALGLVAIRKDPALTKAFAIGLRRAGLTIAKVDKEGELAAVFTQAASLAQGTTTEAAKVEAIELLALATKEQGEAVLMTCLGADQSERVQAAAVKALSELAGQAATASLLSAWKGFKPQARTVTVATLLSRDDGALALLGEMGSGRGGPTSSDLTASQVQALVKHQNGKVSTLAKTVLAAVIPPSREEVVKKFQPALTAKGDAEAGKQVFLARCMACHVAGGEGIEVGPNLVTVKTKGREGLLTAILQPHKEVASQYIAYTVATKDGQTLMGIISQDEAKSMSIKMMGGALMTIQRADIKGSSSSGQSLMPEGIEQGMTVEDMSDLLAFIEQLQ